MKTRLGQRLRGWEFSRAVRNTAPKLSANCSRALTCQGPPLSIHLVSIGEGRPWCHSHPIASSEPTTLASEATSHVAALAIGRWRLYSLQAASLVAGASLVASRLSPQPWKDRRKARLREPRPGCPAPHSN